MFVLTYLPKLQLGVKAAAYITRGELVPDEVGMPMRMSAGFRQSDAVIIVVLDLTQAKGLC
jgi:hypothetical protein